MPARLASYPPGAAFGPRSAADFEFVWILRGSVVWRTAASRILLRPGRLALTRPGDVDSYQWDPATETVHGYVHFTVAEAAALPPRAAWPLVRDSHELPLLDGLCNYLLDLGRLSEEADERTAALLATLLEVFVRGPVVAADPPPAIVREFLAVVRRHWGSAAGPVPVPELAAETGVSPGHLFRVFRQTYGIGPARALEAVRLARAATLLQRSNATLAEVARRCGFANPYHFSRRFTVWYDRPPGAYRSQGDRMDPYEPVRAAGLMPIARALLD